MAYSAPKAANQASEKIGVEVKQTIATKMIVGACLFETALLTPAL